MNNQMDMFSQMNMNNQMMMNLNMNNQMMMNNNMNNQMMMNNNMNNQMNMFNQMNMNNPANMNNNMDMMSLLLQMNNINQMMYNQIMKNFQNLPNQNNQNSYISGGANELRNVNDTGFDPFQGNTKERTNIIFEISSGKKIVMPAPIDVTVFQLLTGFFQKVGLLNKEWQNKINFLYNGRSLLRYKNGMPNNILFSTYSLGSYASPKILVVDLQGLIAA